jgi:hypothetical protein
LADQKVLYPDFLGIHMVRDVKGSTILSYHHDDLDGHTTSAEDLFTRLKLVGRSVYWWVPMLFRARFLTKGGHAGS